MKSFTQNPYRKASECPHLEYTHSYSGMNENDFKKVVAEKNKQTKTKTVWCQQRDRNTSQQDRTEAPEVDSHKYAQIITDTDAKAINGRKAAFSSNGTGTIGHL